MKASELVVSLANLIATSRRGQDVDLAKAIKTVNEIVGTLMAVCSLVVSIVTGIQSMVE